MFKSKLNLTRVSILLGGWSALIAAILFRRNMDAEYYMLRSFGLFANFPASAPVSIEEWFMLLHNHPFLGFVLIHGFDLVNYILVGFIFFAIIQILRGKHNAIINIAAICTVLSIGFFLITNQIKHLFSWSQEYVTGPAVAQSTDLAIGDFLILIHRFNPYSPTGMYSSYLLITIAGLLLAILMKKSDVFTNACAWMGILANGIALSYWGFHFLLPIYEFIAPALAAIFLLIWYILIGKQL